MSHPCLLIIDVQQALVDAGPQDKDAFLDRLATLLAAARKAKVLVAHVQHAEGPGEELEVGTPAWELHPVVRPVGDEPVFSKRFNSAFKDTGLEAWLRDHDVGPLVVAGMQTEHCLDATIKSAFERGFSVIVPEGAHTTFDNGGLTADQVRQWYAGRIWNNRYAKVKAVDEVVGLFLPRQ